MLPPQQVVVDGDGAEEAQGTEQRQRVQPAASAGPVASSRFG